jgi:hypothetical protein
VSLGPYAPRDVVPRVPTPAPERPDGGTRGLGPGERDDAPRPRGATRTLPPDDPALDPRRPARIGRGATALLVAACTLGALQAAVMLAVEARRWYVADREVVRLEREVADLHAEAADLAAIAERGDDVRFREHLARRQGYVFPDEVRYVIALPSAPATEPDGAPSAPPGGAGDPPPTP